MKLLAILSALALAACTPAHAAPPAANLNMTVLATHVVSLSIVCATPDPDGNPNHCDLPIDSPPGTIVATVTAVAKPPGSGAVLSLSGDVSGTFGLDGTDSGSHIVTVLALQDRTYSLILTAVGQ